MNIKERVEKGAKFLDEKMPGWALRIDLKNLDITDGSRCILGQLFKDELRAGSDAWLSPYGLGVKKFESELHLQTHDHGFLLDLSHNRGDLEQAWREAVTARRETTSVVKLAMDDIKAKRDGVLDRLNEVRRLEIELFEEVNRHDRALSALSKLWQ